MPKFRKKPVVIDAVRWAAGRVSDLAPWIVDALATRAVVRCDDVLVIRTLEGEMTANDGDWIIRGLAGEIYPCKPDIFDRSYDPA